MKGNFRVPKPSGRLIYGIKGNFRVPKPNGRLNKMVAELTHPHHPDMLSHIWPAPFNKGSKPPRKPNQTHGRKNDQKSCRGQQRAAVEGEDENGEGEDENGKGKDEAQVAAIWL